MALIRHSFTLASGLFTRSPDCCLWVGLRPRIISLLFLRALDGVSERFETSLVGEGELHAKLKMAVEDLRLHNVRFHGRVDGADLRELYRDRRRIGFAVRAGGYAPSPAR